MDTICLAHERAILGSWTEAISITVLHDRYRRLYLTLCSVVKYRTFAHVYRILEGREDAIIVRIQASRPSLLAKDHLSLEMRHFAELLRSIQ